MAIVRFGTTLAALTAWNTACQIHVFVDDDAPPGGDGLTWATALSDLREAVQLAEDLGSFRGEVRIAGGDYLGDLAEPLEIDRYGGVLSGIVLKGGFAGLALPGASDTRNLSAFVTTLRGLPGAPIVQVSSAAVLTGPRELGPGPFGALSGINLARATVFDGLRFEGQQGIFVSTFDLTDTKAAVVVRDCEFVGGGTGWGRAEGGGAIGAGGASFLIERSRFVSNSSNRGGAISHQFSVLVIEDCVFEANRAGSGGAIWSSANALRIESSTFADNATTNTQGDGGALRVGLSDLVLLSGVDFVGNAAAFGGAISLWQSSIDVVGASFHGNIADADGGAIHAERAGDEVQRFVHTAFIGNQASGSGGAVFVLGGDDVLDIRESALERNSAIGDGGAVCFRGPAGSGVVSVFRCTVTDNTAGDRGGALFGSTVGAGYSDLDRNEALAGGAIYADTVNVLGSSFDSNRALADGGAIHGTIGGFVSSGVFTANAGAMGGAVFGPLEVRESRFENNFASADGGALHGVPVIDECEFDSNAAGFLGGAVFDGGDITRSDFTNNTAGLRGGAIYNLTFGDRLEITGNTAGFGGGGVRLSDSFVLLRSRVVGNALTQDLNPAGEQIVIDGGVGTIDRCLIASESASNTGTLAARQNADVLMLESLVGGQLRLDRGTLDARGCTLVGQPGSPVPAVAGVFGSLVVLESSAVAAERPVELLGSSQGVFIQSYITGGTAGVEGGPLRIDFLGEIVSGDPGFVDPLGPDGDWSTWDDNDYRLRPRSRLIDIGYGLGFDGGDFREDDLAGNDRVKNDNGVPNSQVGPAPVDIGAYEFQGTSCLPDMNDDGSLTPADYSAWIIAYNLGDRFADQNRDGSLTPADYSAWIVNFGIGCDG